MSALIAIPRPISRTTGIDGIPDHVCAIKGAPRYWRPELGAKLDVWCDGVRLRYVVEADRLHGWAVCKKMIEHEDGFVEVPGKAIRYLGRITYRVMTDA